MVLCASLVQSAECLIEVENDILWVEKPHTVYTDTVLDIAVSSASKEIGHPEW